MKSTKPRFDSFGIVMLTLIFDTKLLKKFGPAQRENFGIYWSNLMILYWFSPIELRQLLQNMIQYPCQIRSAAEIPYGILKIP